jgi:crotonobetainyl-CoA:carnitine CoA-transferase CaiB-like acyl-CoA transferase
VTDTQWQVFCREFGLDDLAGDARLKTNGMRVKERAWLLPRLTALTKGYTTAELAQKLETIGLPFAPIAKPWDLLDDPHLNAHGGLMEVTVNGKTIHAPALPLEFDGQRLGKRSDPPSIGEHSSQLLRTLGYTASEVDGLLARRIVAFPP